MFKNIYINFICKIICLLTYILIILFIDNIYTLGILGILVFILVRLDDSILICFLMILNFIGFMLGYLNHSYLLLRILLIISYFYYFLKDYQYCKNNNNKIISNKNLIYDKIYKRNMKRLSKIMKEGEVIDREIVKDKTDSDFENFKNKYIVQKKIKKKKFSMYDILYVLEYLLFLFISIIIGSCVI